MKAPMAVFVASVLVWLPTFNLTAGSPALGKVVPGGPADLNGTRLTIETTVYGGDAISTGPKGLALVLVPNGNQLHVWPASGVKISGGVASMQANLERGALLARSGSAQTISVRAGGLAIEPQGAARYEVLLANSSVVVATHAGVVAVKAGKQVFTVAAGRVMRFEPAAPPLPSATAAPAALSDRAWAAITIAVAAGVPLVGWAISDAIAEGCPSSVSPSFPCP